MCDLCCQDNNNTQYLGCVFIHFLFFPTENFINFPLREQVSLSIILIAEFAEANYNLFYTAVCEWCFQYATLFLTRKKHKLLG